MKKLYFFLLISVFANSVFAQDTKKLDFKFSLTISIRQIAIRFTVVQGGNIKKTKSQIMLLP